MKFRSGNESEATDMVGQNREQGISAEDTLKGEVTALMNDLRGRTQFWKTGLLTSTKRKKKKKRKEKVKLCRHCAVCLLCAAGARCLPARLDTGTVYANPAQPWHSFQLQPLHVGHVRSRASFLQASWRTRSDQNPHLFDHSSSILWSKYFVLTTKPACFETPWASGWFPIGVYFQFCLAMGNL